MWNNLLFFRNMSERHLPILSTTEKFYNIDEFYTQKKQIFYFRFSIPVQQSSFQSPQ